MPINLRSVWRFSKLFVPLHRMEINMQKLNLTAELCANEYPGRGIITGKSACGEFAVMAYFIMGRSENSRNRVFVENKNGIITKAADESKLTDPSLIIYAPCKVYKKTHILTNGDQTDTIYNGLKQKTSFSKSLRIRTFEPDGPHFTPRISAAVKVKNGEMKCKVSILKTSMGNEKTTVRNFYEYSNFENGEGRFIHTYRANEEPLPSFWGEPLTIEIKGDINKFANNIWKSLNEENKISLFVRYINLKTGKFEQKIINKYKIV